MTLVAIAFTSRGVGKNACHRVLCRVCQSGTKPWFDPFKKSFYESSVARHVLHPSLKVGWSFWGTPLSTSPLKLGEHFRI